MYQDQLQILQQIKLPPAPNTNPDHFDVFQNYEFEAENRDNLQEFFNSENNISGWIKLKPDNHSIEYPFYEMNVYDKYSSLYEWIDTQKWPILFIFSLIAIVSFFGLLSSLSILGYKLIISSVDNVLL